MLALILLALAALGLIEPLRVLQAQAAVTCAALLSVTGLSAALLDARYFGGFRRGARSGAGQGLPLLRLLAPALRLQGGGSCNRVQAGDA